MYDAIIIGKGPAGISASLYTARSNLKTLIIGKDDSALRRALKVENYFGFAGVVKGEDILEAGIRQALRLGVDIIDDEVIAIEKNDFFEVTTGKDTYSSKAVLLATGQVRKKISIENLKEFVGKGVSYCSTCDGFFYNNLKVGVLGYKDYAVHEALELLAYTKDITIFTNGRKLELSDKYIDNIKEFKINAKPVTRVSGSDFLQRIHFDDGTSEDIDGIFVAYESASSSDFARKLGVLADGDSIVVDKYQQTNLEGLFAAGDCTGGLRQIATAVGQGAMAGKRMGDYIRSL
ncbi:MAG: NAD(P)/FAD-dependent oxidoreductase [Clostridiales bacterium]|jgi:thioredoxin reductase (NADPH)|nr:NAD(P)/FAD-dependent oxidoreductase [Eubacteriales bacterium]MDH7566527.1 NAD(P)/FAD-dependent oxidoreductase [Clostridiales bacterium]